GEIKLTLWGEQISKVREGDEVSISGAYITEFQGELQLNVPKKGLLEVGIKE
ncbi:DNA-binding protein, partial [archaeon CG_4_8_14_3_um_filter_38_5]